MRISYTQKPSKFSRSEKLPGVSIQTPGITKDHESSNQKQFDSLKHRFWEDILNIRQREQGTGTG